MCSTDIPPSRLEAAEAAALSFIQRQKATTQIGIVAFSGFAELIQPPTTDQEALQAAIESLTTGAAHGDRQRHSQSHWMQSPRSTRPSRPAYASESLGPNPRPCRKGAYAPDIIVLLTDGVSNAGPLPIDAAQQAADRGVRIYTIGFGTANGTIPFDQRDPFGRALDGGGFRTGIDEETLKKIAEMTDGKYYAATSASELEDVFRSLPDLPDHQA